jgi:1-acyl-sn-glycerol-3-phosphate acyltransferase
VADDAVVVDTTGRTVDEVVAEVVERYRKIVPAEAPAERSPKRVAEPKPKGATPAPTRRGDLTFYKFCRALVVGLARVLWRLKVVHGERIPRSGAYVLAPTHRSVLDTPFLGAVTRRRIRFMGKAELWKKGWSARFLSALGGFPVERGVADRSALRSAIAAVEGGEPLAVFPEGTRRHGPLIEDLHDGVAYVAARVGVPIIPVGIGGSEEILAKGRKLPRLHRVVLVVGEPLDPPSRTGSVRRGDVAALTERLQAELQALFDEAQELAGD